MSKPKVTDIAATGLVGAGAKALFDDGTWKVPAGGGGVGPIIRGVAQTNSGGTASFTIALPAGTIADDLAIMFGGGGWPVSNPAGWEVLFNDDTGIVGAGGFWKLLDATDITNGYVTFSLTGSYECGACLVVIEKDSFDAANPIYDSGHDMDTGSPITPTTNVGSGIDLIITTAYERTGGVIGFNDGVLIESYNAGSRSQVMLSDQASTPTYTVTFTPVGSNGILGMAVAISPAGGSSGGGVSLEKSGVPVGSGPFDTLNFSGTAVTSVTDAGGGQADIILTAGSGGGGGSAGLFDISMGVPLLSALTPIGSAYATYTENPELGINVKNTTTVGGNSTLLGWTKAKPATEFHVATLQLPQVSRLNYWRPMIGVFNSANGRFETISMNIDASTGGQIELAVWSAYNNRVSTAAVNGPYSLGPFWMHVKFDGAHIFYGYSFDGANPFWAFTRTLADYVGAITDVFVGMFAFTSDALNGQNNTVLCWDEDGNARVMGVAGGSSPGGGAYRPMVDGSLPPNLMYAPDGSLIMEAFTP